MNINSRLLKCISILLVCILIMGIVTNIILGNKSQAKAQNTKEYKKGSSMLDDYPGYSSLLDNLLKEHPDWSFTILYTGLDWNTVIKNETTVKHGRNLVQNKSGEWVCSICGNKAYDNGSWRCASAATVSYYMDPRNALNEDYIFQFENLEWKDGTYTTSGVQKILDGTFMDTSTIKYKTSSGATKTISKSYAKVIMEAAEAAGISPYHLASRIVQEQGSTGSSTSSGTYSGYKGYYNFLNVNATGSSSTAIIKNALAYAKKKGWSTPEKAIKGGAEFLADGYISSGQNTLYLQKFDVDDSDGSLYSHQYMQNVSAARSESLNILSTYREIDDDLDMSFNFLIPVYDNMPTSRCPMPGTQSIVTQNIQVTASSLVVYKERSKSSAKLKTLKKNDKILRIEIGSDKVNGYKWDKVVLSDGTKGYVVSGSGYKKISDITNCNISAIAVEPGNVRNGPGTSNTTTLLTLTVGQRVTIIEKGKYNNVDGYSWSRIKLSDGTQGYIVARYLEEITSSGSTSSGKDIVEVVCNGGLTLRKSPGTSSTILGYIDKGEELTRIEKQSSTANGYIWDKVVTDSGKTGYVARGDDDEVFIKPIKGSDDAITPDDLKDNSSGSSTAIKGSGFETSGSNLMCEPDITVSNVKSKASGAVIKNASGKTVTSGNIGTGYTITYNGKTYTVVKLGDTNGDGKVNSGDSLIVKQHVAKVKSITNKYYSEAADVNEDGKINSGDSLIVKQQVANVKDIEL